jgi:hypothetical protein|tara:strand:- start:757 stop:1416 length:660 start_codon:yes stop_codon:yes gene_type:complete
MKIAILLCGHIRTWNECKSSFFNFFPNDVDIFVHTYTTKYSYHPFIKDKLQLTNEINQTQITKTNEMFGLPNFKRVVFEKELSNDDVDLSEYPVNLDIYSQIRKVNLCNDLKKEWEKDYNFKYDIVIKTRFDIYYQGLLNLENIYSNKIYYLTCNGTLEPSDVCYLCLSKDFDKFITELTKKYKEKIINPHTWMKLCIKNINFESSKITSECFVKRLSH